MTDPRAKADATRVLKHVQAAGGALRFFDELDIHDDRRAPDGDGDVYALLIGARGELTRAAARRAAVAFNKIAAKAPKAAVQVVIAGWDDDPQELWDNAEAREFVRQWARFAGLDSVAAAQGSPLVEDSICFLARCGAFPDVDPGDVGVIARS